MPVLPRNTVNMPNLGLYLGISPSHVPKRGFRDCLNIRVKLGDVVRDNLGWAPFPNSNSAINLESKPVTLIDSFLKRDSTVKTIFGNTTDLYQFDDAADTISYLTPRYSTGTVAVTNGSAVVTGTGTSWDSELKAGDAFHVGDSNQTDPGATWYEILSVDNDTQVTLTANYAGSTASGQDYTARKLFTGDAADPFFTEVFYNGNNLSSGDTQGDRWYACNGIDKVVAWDGEDDMVYYPDLGNIDSCVMMRRHKNQMVYVAPTLSGSFESQRIRTSEIGEPENTVSGDATELIVKDGADPLLAAYPIGEQLALYAEKSVILAQYVGPPLVYAFRTAVTGYGPFSSRAVAVFPDYHDFVGEDLQYRFDGATIQAVNSHVWRDILRRTSPVRKRFLHNHFYESQGELLWSVPLTTDEESDTELGPPEQAFVEHYIEDTGDYPNAYTRRELPALVFGRYRRESSLTFNEIAEQWQNFNYRWNDKFFNAGFPMTLFGDMDGNIFILDGASDKNGTGLTSFVRFGQRVIGSVENKGVIRRVYPFIQQMPESEGEVTVRIYGTNTPGGRAELQMSSLLSEQAFSLAIGTDRHFVSPRVSIRYAEVEIRTVDITDYWALNGYAIDTVPGGGR